MAFIETADATRLYYEDWGQGAPIVFVHGWPLSGGMWEYQTVPLTRAGFRCITYDRRGFGRSDKPFAGYDYETLGRDLAQLIEALDVQNVTLVGFSMGGGEVVEYLTRHNRGRVARAMLVSSIVPYMLKTPNNPDGVDEEMFQEMADGILDDRPAFLTEFAKQFFGFGLLAAPVSDPFLAAYCEAAMGSSPIAMLECVKAFSRTDFRAAVRAITTPVLVIHGDADKTVPIAATGKQAAELIPKAEMKIYDGAPHGLYYTHRHQLTRDIAAFASEGRIAILDRAA